MKVVAIHWNPINGFIWNLSVAMGDSRYTMLTLPHGFSESDIIKTGESFKIRGSEGWCRAIRHNPSLTKIGEILSTQTIRDRYQAEFKEFLRAKLIEQFGEPPALGVPENKLAREASTEAEPAALIEPTHLPIIDKPEVLYSDLAVLPQQTWFKASAGT